MSKAKGGQMGEELSSCLSGLESSLSQLEGTFSEFLQQPMEELCSGGDPLAVARLNVSLAYSLHAMFYIYLKSQGVPTKDHPVQKELERVKTYMQKLKHAENDKVGSTPTATVNVEGAKRVIAHNTDTKEVGKRKATDLSSSRRSTPMPKSAHLEFREYEQRKKARK